MRPALVVINPISGTRRTDAGRAAEIELARAVLSEAGYAATVVVTTGPGHASEAARQAVAAGSGLVVAWGGDGTMNEVARVLAFGQARLALVPGGSGNGLARDLEVPRHPRRALAVAASGRPWRIDAGEIDGGLFFNVAGLGLDARVAHAFAANRGRRGILRYLHLGVRELASYRAGEYEIAVGAERWVQRALFIAIANSRQYGGHGRIAPRAVLDDGRLDLVVVDDLPAWRVLSRVPETLLGRLQPGNGVAMHAVTELAIAAAQPCELHLDGEPRAGSGPLRVRVHPGAITVMAPRDASTPTATTR